MVLSAGEDGVEQGGEGVAGRVVGPPGEDAAGAEVGRQGAWAAWLVERCVVWVQDVLR